MLLLKTPLVAALGIVFFAAADPASAQPATTMLRELARSAAIIAVTRVIRVERVGGVKVASVRVLRPIKGARAGQTLSYIAQPTWTCDTSTAALGETTLLFLDRFEGQRFAAFYPREYARLSAEQARRRRERVPIYQVAQSGAGRMPILVRRGEAYLRCGFDGDWATSGSPRYLNSVLIQLPRDFALVADPEPPAKYGRTGQALATLRSAEALVRRSLTAARRSVRTAPDPRQSLQQTQ